MITIDSRPVSHAGMSSELAVGGGLAIGDPPPLPRARRKIITGDDRAAAGSRGESAGDQPSRLEMELLHHRRGLIERLLDHAAHLDTSDAALLRSVYDHGLSATQLARALRQHPRAVRARVHRLIMRISSPGFQFVVRQKDRWPPRRRQVAECIILRARTQRQTARDLGITVHEVRKHLAHLAALIDAFPEIQRRA